MPRPILQHQRPSEPGPANVDRACCIRERIIEKSSKFDAGQWLRTWPTRCWPTASIGSWVPLSFFPAYGGRLNGLAVPPSKASQADARERRAGLPFSLRARHRDLISGLANAECMVIFVASRRPHTTTQPLPTGLGHASCYRAGGFWYAIDQARFRQF